MGLFRSPRNTNGIINLADTNAAPDKDTADTAPCVGCGICCDGTIYGRAIAGQHEENRLTRAGLTVIREGEKLWFQHPCRFSKSGLCTIYGEERFSICHTFRCKLLKAYQAGEVSPDEALATVQKALALRSAVVTEAPGAALSAGRKEIRARLEETKDRPGLHLKIAALDHFLDKWFRE